MRITPFYVIIMLGYQLVRADSTNTNSAPLQPGALNSTPANMAATVTVAHADTTSDLAAVHLTSAEVQECKDGQAFAQERYNKSGIDHTDIMAMTDYGSSFFQDAVFLNHSNYFNIGAYYQQFKIMDLWSRTYIQVFAGTVDDTHVKLARSGRQVALAGLYDTFKVSGLTDDQLAALTGKPSAELKTLFEKVEAETKADGKSQ